MAIKAYSSETLGGIHYMVERNGKKYPFSDLRGAQECDAQNDEVVATFFPWEGPLPEDFTEVPLDAPQAELHNSDIPLPEELDDIGRTIGLSHDEGDPKALTLRLHRAEIALIGMALHYYIGGLSNGSVETDNADDTDKQELVAKYTMLRLAAALESADPAPVTH